jgi:hypothetical protein
MNGVLRKEFQGSNINSGKKKTAVTRMAPGFAQ